jgi:hypothetical protein
MISLLALNFTCVMRRICTLQKLVILVGLFIFPLFSKGKEMVKIEKLKAEINFDGIPDEAVWQNVIPLNLVMHYPDFKGAPIEKSTVRVAYEKEFLWVSAILSYKDNNNIVSNSKKRDEEFLNSDAFGILLDTYNDNENSVAFFTMPAGQRIDFTIMNDASGIGGLRQGNYSWNTFWDVKTARINNGWSVEMKIPFSSLRFQKVDNTVVMGITVIRNITHANELDTYPAIDPANGTSAPIKPSLTQSILLTDVQQSNPLYISPYISGGVERNNELNKTKLAYDLAKDNKFTAGLDMKYSLTSNLTMDLTVNTDFSQVEADDEQINLSRYSLFLPEKRMFFQERASIFNFSLGGPDQLFYSRRIGLEDGESVPILGGGRLTGRVGEWDLGIMNMQTGSKGDDESFKNFGVARIRRRIINSNSFIGGILTSRIGKNGENFFSYGGDAIVRLFGNDYIDFKIAQTTDTTSNGQQWNKNRSFVSFQWERRNRDGFYYDLSYKRSGADFDPKVGFISMGGLSNYDSRLGYGWIADPSSKLISYEVHFSYRRSNSVETDLLMIGSYGPGCSIVTKKGWSWRFGVNMNQQGLEETFNLTNDVYIEAGNYNYLSGRLSLSTPVSKAVSSRFTLSEGKYYDGNNFGITVEPVFNISSKINLTCCYDMNHVEFDVRKQEFMSHIGRLKLTYMHNTKFTIKSFVQYNSLSHMAQSNFTLRYNPKEGNDLYIVYKEARPTKDYFDQNVSHVAVLNQMIQMKYVHTFQL